MYQNGLSTVSNLGIIGLLLVMCLEGASVPFPGVFIVLAYGYMLHMDITHTLFISCLMSAIYTVASLIPYYISLKCQAILPKKVLQGMNKAQGLFQRFGMWSIAVTRPFGIGNYISYVAGICKVKVIPYCIYTFLGIFPWCFIILKLGSYTHGDADELKQLLFAHEWLLVICLISVILILVFLTKVAKKKIRYWDKRS